MTAPKRKLGRYWLWLVGSVPPRIPLAKPIVNPPSVAEIGLHMRAASMDFSTSRMLGVRANRVISLAVLLSGALAAVVAVMLTVQSPLVTPDFALRDTIVVLAGVVVGGLNRPIPATLGGFTIGFATGVLGGALPTNQSQYLPALVFAAVILVLLVRPRGLFDFSKTVERV